MKTAQQDRIKNIEYRISKIEKKGKAQYSKINIQNSQSSTAGFTLVEILVATAVFLTLLSGVVLTLNPIKQLNKAKDATRSRDLQSIKVAIDTYYQDTNCYPHEIPFGNEWRVRNANGQDTVYMKEVPQDPDCTSSNSSCYRYRTVEDTNDSTYSCPQWNVLFAPVTKASSLTNVCPLTSLSNCIPQGYDQGTWACTLSGAVDCDSLLAVSSLTGGVETVGPTATPTPGPTATPTPTPTPDPLSGTFPLLQGGTPDLYEVTINHLWAYPLESQSWSVKVSDSLAQVEQVQVVVTSDGGAQATFNLNPPSGSPNNEGSWTGVRQVGATETFEDTYYVEFFARDALGNTNGSTVLPIRTTGQ